MRIGALINGVVKGTSNNRRLPRWQKQTTTALPSAIYCSVIMLKKDTGRLSRFFRSLTRGDRTAAVSVTFDAEGTLSTVPYNILLDTGGLNPGDYDLAIQNTDDVTRETASTMRTITLQ